MRLDHELLRRPETDILKYHEYNTKALVTVVKRANTIVYFRDI